MMRLPGAAGGVSTLYSCANIVLRALEHVNHGSLCIASAVVLRELVVLQNTWCQLQEFGQVAAIATTWAMPLTVYF